MACLKEGFENIFGTKSHCGVGSVGLVVVLGEDGSVWAAHAIEKKKAAIVILVAKVNRSESSHCVGLNGAFSVKKLCIGLSYLGDIRALSTGRRAVI